MSLPHLKNERYSSLEEMVSTFKKHIPQLQLHINEVDAETFKINLLIIPKNMRRQGLGSSVMEGIIRYSDETGKTILLEPDSVFGTPQQNLILFYKNFGFTAMRTANIVVMQRKPTLMKQ